jgi:hypothetical protein
LDRVQQLLCLLLRSYIFPHHIRVQEPHREAILIKQATSKGSALEQALQLPFQAGEFDTSTVVNQEPNVVQSELDQIEGNFEIDFPSVTDLGDRIRDYDLLGELV